jgi:transposase InsO family protein
VRVARRVRRAGRGNGPRDNLDTAPRSDPYTKLQGPTRGVFYELYVIIGIYSRYVIAWMVAPRVGVRPKQRSEGG